MPGINHSLSPHDAYAYMYLEHFKLNEPPFRVTPATEFFFSGANRGEILDALIYSLNKAEGIIKVSGEVGSGKTMLCRMLLERLPKHIEAIHLANPSLSREEMLYAIADALGLRIDGERVGIIMQSIQNKLEEKVREGKRVVVLADEAHAMPPDTLEELRLLYNLQTSNSKLLQIVLFGQPELNVKLEQPNMRQLKDRIVHHFNIQPLSRNILESYLMFRMRAAGYHGPNIFSPSAVKLIASTSNGLMRRINILADKSLLAAFIEDTHNIEAKHVQAAIRDSELQPVRTLPDKRLLLGGVAAIFLISLAVLWKMEQGKKDLSGDLADASVQSGRMVATQAVTAPPDSATNTADNAKTARLAPSPPISGTSRKPVPVASNLPIAASSAPVAGSASTEKSSLFEQRLVAGKQLLGQKKSVASIQLFCDEKPKAARIEDFLKRADTSGQLPKIYLLPIKSDNRNGLCVLYGAYPSMEAARNEINELPPHYKETFATSIYIF